MSVAGRTISSFRVILFTVVLCIISAAIMPFLHLQYMPEEKVESIRVGFSMPGVQARAVESDATSLIEGALSTVRGCSGVRSTSQDGGGSVTLTLDRGTDLQAARFEVATLIRNIYTSLPEGCTYPTISASTRGTKTKTAMSYVVTADMPTEEIGGIVDRAVIQGISRIDGVTDVSLYGITSRERVIIFDHDRLESLSVTPADLASAVRSALGGEELTMKEEGGRLYPVRLAPEPEEDIMSVAVARSGDRIIRLSDVAYITERDAAATSFHRVNGLNSVTLTVTADGGVNLLDLCSRVSGTVDGLSSRLPEGMSMKLSYDASEYVKAELSKILTRTFLCLLILLAFVLVTSRSWRYTMVVAVSILVSLLLSCAVYVLIGLDVHIYTLAGITVSFGIIIDNTIVMVDHYSRHGDRKIFASVLGAVLTTVVALLAVYLLPEKDRANLADFSTAIVVNLSVSLVVALLFIPALLDYFPVRLRQGGVMRRWGWYGSYIRGASRFRILYIIGTIGLMVWPSILFGKALKRSDFYREPSRMQLSIRAGMPEGCTVDQLNEVMREMEEFLASVEGIDMFETSISSPTDGRISVTFLPEYERSWMPRELKDKVIALATDLGGANWSVSGVDDQYFSNWIVTQFLYYGIEIKGYDYDRLYAYAQTLADKMKSSRRMQDVTITPSGSSSMPGTEFGVDYDREALVASGVNPYSYHDALQSPLFRQTVGRVHADGRAMNLVLESSAKEYMDVWHVLNEGVELGESRVKLSQVGSIEKGRTNFPIIKENQSYSLSVRYNFSGSSVLNRNMAEELVDEMNGILPTGFKAESEWGGGWFEDEKENYLYLVMLVLAGIFVVLAVQFESFRLPLAVILTIPFAFIGCFLAFGLTDFTFDKGGFASLVMLCGLTVNAGIYIVSGWQRKMSADRVEAYSEVFFEKLYPIILTILSTVFGLVPFLFDGPSEVFWFDFAVGTICGLCLSLPAIIFVLPALVVRRRRSL